MVPRIFLPWNPFPVHLKIFHQGSSPTVPGCSADLRKVGNDSTDVNNNLTVNLNIDHNINLIIDQNIDHTIDLTQTEGGEEDADSGTSQSWSTNCASMQFPTYLILFIAYLCKVNKCHSQSICIHWPIIRNFLSHFKSWITIYKPVRLFTSGVQVWKLPSIGNIWPRLNIQIAEVVWETSQTSKISNEVTAVD